MTTAVLWFRRDLRLGDNPALVEAANSDAVVPLFVLDPALWNPAGPSRRGYLRASLRALADDTGGLVVRVGDPVIVVPEVVAATGASSVHVAADFGPYGARRDAAVEAALTRVDVPLVRTGSPYAVTPGRVRGKGDDSYQVFSPYLRAWLRSGWPDPVPLPDHVAWDTDADSDELPEVTLPEGLALPEAGERAALRRWRDYLATGLTEYVDVRNRPDLDATSHMSVHLKWGEVHPRTLLAGLAGASARGASVTSYRNELAWRDFYADVLHRRPDSAREHYRLEYGRMEFEPPGATLDAWREGRTGYPIVDAGMRQLRAEGWMHNRVRMIVASFLVKDLHLEWQHGARHFMHWLVDGDLASNVHGWQWTAGSGTDPAPFFRIFNPIEQGRKFDPRGDYIRRYVAELADVPAPQIHEPREPVVDHAAERREALARYERMREG